MVDLIDSAQRRGSDIVSNISQMGTDIGNSEIDEDSTDRVKLESEIDETVLVLNKLHVNYSESLIIFVRKLQDYINDNGIQVKRVFADISRKVGYPIKSENIEDIS